MAFPGRASIGRKTGGRRPVPLLYCMPIVKNKTCYAWPRLAPIRDRMEAMTPDVPSPADLDAVLAGVRRAGAAHDLSVDTLGLVGDAPLLLLEPRRRRPGAAQYIGRYLGHPPLATSHLGDYDDQQVTYWYIDMATKVKQTITCSALDFISRLVPHIPPKGMQLVRYAGLYARSIKRRCADLAHTALEALCTQLPLFALELLRKVLPNPKWRERIKASFGYDPLACPRCG
jgi:hypothetical protein